MIARISGLFHFSHKLNHALHPVQRYMAVEVIRKDPYNLKADVFSFSILLWEIMALTKPYNGVLGPQVKESVSLYGERPTISRSWPVGIRKLLRRGVFYILLTSVFVCNFDYIYGILFTYCLLLNESINFTNRLFSIQSLKINLLIRLL